MYLSNGKSSFQWNIQIQIESRANHRMKEVRILVFVYVVENQPPGVTACQLNPWLGGDNRSGRLNT